MYQENIVFKEKYNFIPIKDSQYDYEIYVDGSCGKNGGYASAIIILDYENRIETDYILKFNSNKNFKKFKSVFAELSSVIFVLNFDFLKNKKVGLFYDCEAIVNWSTNLSKDTLKDDIRAYYFTLVKWAKQETQKLDFIKVKAHSTDFYNNKVDAFAKIGTQCKLTHTKVVEEKQMAENIFESNIVLTKVENYEGDVSNTCDYKVFINGESGKKQTFSSVAALLNNKTKEVSYYALKFDEPIDTKLAGKKSELARVNAIIFALSLKELEGKNVEVIHSSNIVKKILKSEDIHIEKLHMFLEKRKEVINFNFFKIKASANPISDRVVKLAKIIAKKE